MVVLWVDLELPYWLGILITLAVMLVFGALFNSAVYYPLRNRGFQPVIISTIGASGHIDGDLNGALPIREGPIIDLSIENATSHGQV